MAYIVLKPSNTKAKRFTLNIDKKYIFVYVVDSKKKAGTLWNLIIILSLCQLMKDLTD